MSELYEIVTREKKLSMREFLLCVSQRQWLGHWITSFVYPFSPMHKDMDMHKALESQLLGTVY